MALLNVIALFLWLAAIWFFYVACYSDALVKKLKRLIVALLFVCLGFVASSMSFVAHTFKAFTSEKLIARVNVEKTGLNQYQLTYTPTESSDDPPQIVDLRGDQWIITGGIIKWHPFLQFLGMSSYHMPMRIGGQYSDIHRQRTELPTVHALYPGVDKFWEMLYKADPYLFFVDAAYGSSAFVYFESDKTAEIYVNETGYFIKRKSDVYQIKPY